MTDMEEEEDLIDDLYQSACLALDLIDNWSEQYRDIITPKEKKSIRDFRKAIARLEKYYES